MVNEQYDRAKKILQENSYGHNKLADLLISREVIFAEDGRVHRLPPIQTGRPRLAGALDYCPEHAHRCGVSPSVLVKNIKFIQLLFVSVSNPSLVNFS